MEIFYLLITYFAVYTQLHPFQFVILIALMLRYSNHDFPDTWYIVLYQVYMNSVWKGKVKPIY